MGWREQITWKKRVEQRGRIPGLEVREVRKGEGHAWLPGHRGHPRYGPQTSASAPRGLVRHADPQAPPRPPEAETPGRGRVSRVAARLQGTQMPVQAPGRCCSPSGASAAGAPALGEQRTSLGFLPGSPLPPGKSTSAPPAPSPGTPGTLPGSGASSEETRGLGFGNLRFFYRLWDIFPSTLGWMTVRSHLYRLVA